VHNRLNQIKNNFSENIKIVESLMKFDETIAFFCLSALRKANDGLEKLGCANHPSCNIKPMIKQIEDIRQHGSLQLNYEIMFNQCVVLLVSYFGSAIEDLFQAALQNKIDNKELGKLEGEEIKLTVGQLVYDRNIVDLFISKKDISFQGMQSISRAFEQYIGINEVPRDKIINNIIIGQACRHCIVHDGSTVNKKVIGQIKSANPRELKPDLKVEDKILFTEDEIKVIATSMMQYIDRLIGQLTEKPAKSTS
jgi:hypothetical protein